MKTNHTLLVLALFASMLSAEAQTVERTFYIDYGQNNVTNQGYKTVLRQGNRCSRQSLSPDHQSRYLQQYGDGL